MRAHVELYKAHLAEQKERAFAQWQSSGYRDEAALEESLRAA